MNIQEANSLAKKIVNSFELNDSSDGIIVLNRLGIKTLKDKIVMRDVSCIAVEFSKPLDPNLYFMNAFDYPTTKDVRWKESYQEKQTDLEIIYRIIYDKATTDAEIEFDFIIKDEEICCQYKAIAKTENNRQSYSYELRYVRNSNDSPNTINTEYLILADSINIVGSIPFIGIYNDDYLCNININNLTRLYDYEIIQARDYNFSDPRGAFPNIYIKKFDNKNSIIASLNINISDISLSFYNISEVKNLRLAFNSEDENREKDTFKDYINYRLKTNYIQDITNIAFNITIWNLELAFNDYKLIKHHKLFTILAFNFDKKYLDGFLKKPYDKLYIKDKINLYSALLLQVTTIEQKITLHRYEAYYSSRLDKLKNFIFWLTEDYNKIKYPLIGMIACLLTITIINTIYHCFVIPITSIGVTNISDIFQYRIEISWVGLFTFLHLFLSIAITAIFGYLSYALSIAIKRRFGMGNPKDMS